MNSTSIAVVPSVLVVGDEPVLLGIVKNYLERAGMSARTCGDGLTTLNLVRATASDVVVLDLDLPGMDGAEMCRQLHTSSDYYVLMLAARADEVDKLIGLSVGADDYMAKPFSPRELVTRIQVLLRRPRAGSTGTAATVVHRIGALTLGPSSRRVEPDMSPMELTRAKFDLLQALAEHPGWVLNHRQLTDIVWGEDRVGDDHLVDVHITHLRKKLGDDPSQPRSVQTVHGVGCRMDQRQWCHVARAAVEDADCCGPRWPW